MKVATHTIDSTLGQNIFTKSFLKAHCNIPEGINPFKIIDRTSQQYCIEYYGESGVNITRNLRFYHQYANRLRLEVKTYKAEWEDWHDVITYPCARTASEIGHPYGDYDSEAYSTQHVAESPIFEGEDYIVLTCFDGDDDVWAVYSVKNEVNFKN